MRTAVLTVLLVVADFGLAADEQWARKTAINYTAHGVYVLYDVLSYPTWGKDDLVLYRATQYVVQAGIVYTLQREAGWETAIGWLLEWWTFFDDILYYPLYDLLYGETATRDELFGNKVTWAWWTPVGLFGHGGRRQPIAGDVLMKQMVVGVAGGFGIRIFLRL